MSKVCPNCQTENKDAARFCYNCATPLITEIVCPQCGTGNLPQARFCYMCATALTPSGALQTGMLSPRTLLAGRYMIVQRAGSGGMGAVYQVSDTRIPGKLWAVKEMSDAAITSPLEKQKAQQAFMQEAQLLATLSHPNLPSVTDFFAENNKQYLVMEFIEGEVLEDMLANAPGPLPEAQVIAWGTQLCDVLGYLHSRKPPVIFRDLKPANVMVDADGKLKLIDFGIARLFKPGQARDTAAFGTSGYAPPEQYGQGQTDARADLYALGVLLHQLATRYDPTITPFSLPPARRVNPAVSARLETVIIKATQTEIHARYQDAAEMRKELATKEKISQQEQRATLPVGAQHAAPPLAQQPAPPRPGEVRDFDGVEMVYIPAGEFTMGSSTGQSDEKPVHKVHLDGYWIDRYPVTNAEYKRFVDATGHRKPKHWVKKEGGLLGIGAQEVDAYPHDKDNHPVVYVSWEDAAAYAQWKGKRLPTEAEWEKAARGTDGRKYPWGNDWDANKCNSCSHARGTTQVGKYSPAGDSPYSVADMAGNVWEWCADWYDADYYTNSPERNPGGPPTGKYRVVRGGAWSNNVQLVRTAFRSNFVPLNRLNFIGVRCVQDASP